MPFVMVACIDAVSIADPTPPSPPPPHGPTQNPPPPKIAVVRARVINIKVVGDQTAVTVSAGSLQGVDKTWSGHYIDNEGHSLPGRLTVIRVDKSLSVWITDLTPDQLKQSSLVRLEQP